MYYLELNTNVASEKILPRPYTPLVSQISTQTPLTDPSYIQSHNLTLNPISSTINNNPSATRSIRTIRALNITPNFAFMLLPVRKHSPNPRRIRQFIDLFKVFLAQ